MFQKNRGKPLDYHYTEYSMHYNLCSQLASRIRNFNGGVNTPGYNQLRQQFNAQFKQRDKDASVMLQSSPAEIARDLERKSSLISHLLESQEPLKLEETEEMRSVSGDSLESFSTVSGSEEEFESVGTSCESEEEEEKEEKEEESSDEDDELLVKTGVSTVSISNQDLPSLEKKKVPKRIRISVSAW